MPMTSIELRELRKSAGLTQEELAKLIGMSRKSVNEAENSQKDVEKRTELATRYVFAPYLAKKRLMEESENASHPKRQALIRAASIIGFLNELNPESVIYRIALSAAEVEQIRDAVKQ